MFLCTLGETKNKKNKKIEKKEYSKLKIIKLD